MERDRAATDIGLHETTPASAGAAPPEAPPEAPPAMQPAPARPVAAPTPPPAAAGSQAARARPALSVRARRLLLAGKIMTAFGLFGLTFPVFRFSAPAPVR